MGNILRNLEAIKARIASAEKTAGREQGSVKLIAVSKTHHAEEILEVPKNMVFALGENRVQELSDKYDALKNNYDIHFIGHLQKNKVRHVVDKVTMLHSVDSEVLVDELSKRLESTGKVLDVLIQVNTSGEYQKSGTDSESIKPLIEKIMATSNVRLCGLMTIGLFTSNIAEVQREFALLRELFEKVKTNFDLGECFTELSMGMTGDFEIAIKEGATMVRIGSAIFGTRI